MIAIDERVIVRRGDVIGIVIGRESGRALVEYHEIGSTKLSTTWFPLAIVHPAPKEKETS